MSSIPTTDTGCGLPQGGTWGVLHPVGFPKEEPGGSYMLWASTRWDLGGLTGCGHPQGGTLGVSRVLSGPSGSEKPRPLGPTSMVSKLHSVFCIGAFRNEKVKF